MISVEHPTPYSLRPAKKSDARDLVEIYYGALARDGAKVIPETDDLQRMEKEILSPESHTIVAADPRNPDILLAFVNYVENAGDLFVQGLFAIENSFHAAARLLGHTVLKADSLQLQEIAVDSSPKAESYYEKHGFIRQKEIVTGGGRRYTLPVAKADKLRI